MIFRITSLVLLTLWTLFLAFYLGYEVLGSFKLGMGIMLFVLVMVLFAIYDQVKKAKMKKAK
ncbi:hypothetical protein [Cytobacillus gottheilii]|uniref:hypothetical protein n=1 Tax=Cytobacillus gottheilii TaxID=859144 RepID=UPI002493F1D8|nr:hypothetical protein [Cytobacillus gottheilii]